MARELVEKAGVGESADRVWRELDRERGQLLPQPPAVRVEEDENPVFDSPGADPINSPVEQAGVHLVESPAGVGIRKNPSPWPTAMEHAVQLSLFG